MPEKIHVPEADGMPLERWTAYMHCRAHELGLSKGQFYLGEEDGKSYIYIESDIESVIDVTSKDFMTLAFEEKLEPGKCYRFTDQEIPEYPHDFNPLRDEPFNKYRKED